MHQPVVLARFGWLLGALIAALFAVLAGLWAWGENVSEETLLRLNERLSTPYQAERWTEQWSALATAARFNPFSAEYPYRQALAAQRIGSSRLAEAGVAADVDRFINDLYHRALSRRPHWGALWARVASMKAEHAETVPAVWAALDRAKTFALYEPEVLQTELRLGFSRWPQLDAEQREAVRETVAFLLEREPRPVIDLAIAFGWVDQLRPMLSQALDIGYLHRRLKRAELFSPES